MGADNWAICPKCKIEIEAGHAKELADIQGQYGVLPRDEWIRAYVNVNRKPKIEERLREDYSIGITDGTFSVRYKAVCDRCGFTFKYEYSTSTLKAETGRL